MRSFTGCRTCRRRKLKCDETRPVCGQCRKSSRTCSFSIDANFRHYGTPSQQRGEHVGDDSLQVENSPSRRRENYRSRGCNSAASMSFPPVSARVEECNATDENTVTSDHESANPNASNREYQSPSVPNGSSPRISYSDRAQASLSSPRSTTNTAGNPNRTVARCSRTLWLALLMHFKQSPGSWMDMFDQSAYFTTTVPYLASGNALLKAAICALAAKHIHRIQMIQIGQLDRQLDKWYYHYKENGKSVDWKYKYCDFYDQAIVHLNYALQFELSDGPAEVGRQSSEELLAAIAILSMYELMDSPSEEWRAHLSALLLLDVASQNILQQGISPPIYPTQPKRSIFWSFVRQDSLSAFLHETQTRLDFTASDLWRQFGLPIDEHGMFSGIPINAEGMYSQKTSEDILESPLEETLSNAMMWIRGKIINFITAGDSIAPEEFSKPADHHLQFGISQEVLLERWQALKTQLDMWHAALPDTFTPYTRSRDPASTETLFYPYTPESRFDPIYYHLPICAATMQTYHMARILLLVNKPQETTAVRSTVTARLHCYRHIRNQVLWHSREICGISSAQVSDAVRTHSLQPLFVAGQCFDDEADRQALLDILKRVEDEIGWASSYCIEKLQKEWNERFTL